MKMNLSQNLNQVQQLISQTALACGRHPDHILLLAVSKQQDSAAIQEVFRLGIHDFGESYLQEAQKKMASLVHLPLIWHFIGPIQSNKTKGIATHFSWVHSLNRIKIAEQLNHYRPEELHPLNVCLQINVIEEPSKSGILPEHAEELVLAISQLPRLRLRGLMTIPPPSTDPQSNYQVFTRLKELMHELNHRLNSRMDTLSMGMSHDLIPAIQAGATIVRVGQAIFGERQKVYNTI